MPLIQLHEPVDSTPLDSPRRFERVHMFAGRHLGEEEFDRGQAWVDMRLASLLRGRPAGIVHGLQLNLDPSGVIAGSFSVNAGLASDGRGRAVTLYYPLRAKWADLIANWQSAHAGDDVTGVYYLLLERNSREIDNPGTDPCQRMEWDPTRDSRLVVTGTLALQRLNVVSSAVTDNSREQIENLVAADRVDGTFLLTLGSAVPLGLLAIGPGAEGGFSPLWVSQEAGRYEAVPNTGYRVLLNQTSAALRRVMQRAALEVTDANPLAQFLRDNLRLDYLPAAGQLPLDWLQGPASARPSVLWLPSHLGIDMVPVPEEAVLSLIHKHLARRVIDLRRPAGDKLRLLLAVDEPDYHAKLLDIPAPDARLEQDLFRFHMRAHEAWRTWHQQFDRLYYIEPSNEAQPLDPEDAENDQRVRDPAQFKHLGLPTPELAPVQPTAFVTEMIRRADAELDPLNAGVPYPFSKGVPAPPAFYSQWLEAGAPPAVPKPSEDGLVVQYALALVDLEAIENQVRVFRARLEKTRDFLLLLRQQLDSQTVGLAALAGGVAGDGNGLQVARWLPYASLEAVAELSSRADEPQSQPAVTSALPSPFAKSTRLVGAAELKSPSSSGFSSQLLASALSSTSSVSRSNALLASKPQSLSAFELGINKNRLEHLAGMTKTPVTKPAFEAKEYRFSVIDHISPETNEYAKAYFGMKDLLAALHGLFDASDAVGLRRDLRKVGRADDDGEGPGDIDPLARSSRLEAPSVLNNLAAKNAKTHDDGTTVPVADVGKRRTLLLNQYRYQALFKAGRILTQWIAVCEARYGNLERKLQAKLRGQTERVARIEKLAGLIRVARETLEHLDRARIEQLGDYGVTQRLLEEDWRRVYKTNQERTRILTTALRGLYYVRVRATPVAAPLSSQLPLRFADKQDSVPGCDWEEEVELPAALEPFFQTVCEIPIADWARFKASRSKLPEPHSFDFLAQVRQVRFKARPAALPTNSGTDTLQARLQTVQQQNRTVLQRWSGLTMPGLGTSVAQTQAAAAEVLSLEDLALMAGPLRGEGQTLKGQLEHAACCLLERLSQLPGSLRLQWGQLAEDDRIRVEDVAYWPGLERAEASDFNTVRTVAELVGWCFRQLDANASSGSKSALRNLIRALLIHASLGDPNEIVRGMVQVAPRLPRVGERLQVKLNRRPAPGTRLQLLDPKQRVVAILAVEDHGPESTRVNIVDLVQSDIRINTQFSVIANKLTRKKL
jgi:hypothetical protein